MSDAELARIEALAEAATPGEWFNDCGKIGCGESGIGEMDADADGEFVTAARTAVPKLVAALRSARARLGDCCYTNDPCPRAEAAERSRDAWVSVVKTRTAERDAAEQRAEELEKRRANARESAEIRGRALEAAESERDALANAARGLLARYGRDAHQDGCAGQSDGNAFCRCGLTNLREYERAAAAIRAYDAAREGGE